MEHIAVDFILVDALGEEQGDDFVDFRPGGVVSKASRVRHHSCVKAYGGGFAHFLEGTQLHQDAEHGLTRGAELREGI